MLRHVLPLADAARLHPQKISFLLEVATSPNGAQCKGLARERNRALWIAQPSLWQVSGPIAVTFELPSHVNAPIDVDKSLSGRARKKELYHTYSIIATNIGLAWTGWIRIGLGW